MGGDGSAWEKLLEEDLSLTSAEQFYRLAVEFLEESRQGKLPVSPARSAEELWAEWAGPLPAQGRPLPEVLRELKEKVLAHSIRLHHPRYMGHQVAVPLPAAIWMESVTAAMNQSAAVREMSPAGTVIEMLVLGWLAAMAGYGAEFGGVMTSGGVEATYTALLAARTRACPEVWHHGVGARSLAVVCGEHAHYSVERAVGQLGLGTRNCVPVPSREFKMDPGLLAAVLDRLEREGKTVVAVVATAGTTATGSFDDLEAVGAVCRQKGVWLHIDGAHGASALFSESRKSRMKGVRESDSLSWDPHKMMLMPLAAGTLLVREEKALQDAFSQSAPYLFHRQGEARAWDQGLRSFQCSRRNDALKVWVALNRYGSEGMGRIFDRLCDHTEYLYGLVADRPDFQTFHAPESNILCFRYLGREDDSEDFRDILNQRLRARFNEEGTGWITITRLGGRFTLRTVLMNPLTGRSDLHLVVEEIARLGSRLRAEIRL